MKLFFPKVTSRACLDFFPSGIDLMIVFAFPPVNTSSEKRCPYISI